VIDCREKEVGLSPAVASGSKVISAPEQSSVERFLAVSRVHRVFVVKPLGGFVDDTDYSGSGGLSEVRITVVMGNVDDYVQGVWHAFLYSWFFV
jgi:hypothetical protein